VPRWLKIILWIIVIAVSVVVLFTVVFPRVERILEDPTMAAVLVPLGEALRAGTLLQDG
jgi:hypothetical protein